MKDINLLPENIKETAPQIENNGNTSKISAQSVIISIMVFIIMAASIIAPKAYIMVIDKRIDVLRAQINGKTYQEVRNVNNQLAAIEGSISLKNEILSDIDRHSYPVTQAMTSIKNIVPKGCYISSFGFNNNTLTITGYAENSLVMTEFLSQLDRLENLKRSGESESMSFEKINSVYSFNMSLKLSGK